MMNSISKFVKKFKEEISSLDLKNEKDFLKIEYLRKALSQWIKPFEKAEDNISILFSKINSASSERNDESVYIRFNNEIIAVVSEKIIKTEIKQIDKNVTECFCDSFEIPHFMKIKNTSFISTEEELLEIDKKLDYACISVYDHDYRSYEGFSCYIAILTPYGDLFILDAIKFRAIIPNLRLLTCSVKKILHSQRCAKRLMIDFGTIGCFCNFDVPERGIYIDWRIRPMTDYLMSHITNDINECIEKINMKIASNKFEPELVADFCEFITKFDIRTNLVIVEDLFRLRRYLAKKNDESVRYVMTDNQLCSLIANFPTTVDEFEALLPKISSILRLHVVDFILILKKGFRNFSLEGLKMKNIDCDQINIINKIAESGEEKKFRTFGH